jgi:hypothetical protein
MAAADASEEARLGTVIEEIVGEDQVGETRAGELARLQRERPAFETAEVGL